MLQLLRPAEACMKEEGERGATSRLLPLLSVCTITYVSFLFSVAYTNKHPPGYKQALLHDKWRDTAREQLLCPPKECRCVCRWQWGEGEGSLPGASESGDEKVSIARDCQRACVNAPAYQQHFFTIHTPPGNIHSLLHCVRLLAWGRVTRVSVCPWRTLTLVHTSHPPD